MKNLILTTDSYKYSQFPQYPSDTTAISSYVEARGGADESMFLGLQPYLIDYLSRPITLSDLEEAESYTVPHGVPFNKAGYLELINRYGGYAPVEIEAVPEGFVMPTGNVQLQIVNTDPDFAWLTSTLETSLLRAIWYPSTVATKSRVAKQYIKTALELTSDVPVADQIGFKLHDFGARGVSSGESAMLGGMAHLVNFLGTDTVEGLIGARKWYGEQCAGFSIPASEHSTMTSWGREREADAYRNMINLYCGDGKLLAFVADSYDIFKACREIIGGELRELIKNQGGTVVVRPDSGDPIRTPIEVIKILMDRFGYTVNSKGYRVLPDYIRVIQGDGIDNDDIKQILMSMDLEGISAENIAFGMGGGLLQKCNRDDLKYAMKCSARQDTSGKWHDVYKDPIGGGKTSKKGRLGLVGLDGIVTTTKEQADRVGNLLEPVFRNGETLRYQSFAEVRALSEIN